MHLQSLSFVSHISIKLKKQKQHTSRWPEGSLVTLVLGSWKQTEMDFILSDTKTRNLKVSFFFLIFSLKKRKVKIDMENKCTDIGCYL